MTGTIVSALVVLLGIGVVGVFLVGASRTLRLYRPLPQLVIRHFHFLQSDIGYDEAACRLYLLAELRHKVSTDEVNDDRSWVASRSVGRRAARHGKAASVLSGGSADQFQMSIAGTSLPLEVIWRGIKRVMFGPMHALDFVVSQSDSGEICVECWRGTDGRDFISWTSARAGRDPIRIAITRIAERIRIAYPGYHPWLLNQFMEQERFDEALNLVSEIQQSSESDAVIDSVQLADIQAWAHFGAGEFSTASEYFHGKTGVENARAYCECLSGMSDPQTALDYLESVESEFETFEFHYRRGLLLRALERVDESLAALRLASDEAESAIERAEDPAQVADPAWSLVYSSAAQAEIFAASDEFEGHCHSLETQVMIARDLRSIDHSGAPQNFEGLALHHLRRFSEAADVFRELLDSCAIDRESAPDDLEYKRSEAWALEGLSSALSGQVVGLLEDSGIDEDDFPVVSNIVLRLEADLEELDDRQKRRMRERLIQRQKRFEDYIDMNSSEIEACEKLYESDVPLATILSRNAERYEYLRDAINAYESMADHACASHRAEASYGLACVWTTAQVWSDALQMFSRAVELDPSNLDRGLWDLNLTALRDHQ